MEMAVVVYGIDRVSRQKILNWCKRIGVNTPVIINNHPTQHLQNDVKGDNTHFEFSAYHQAVRHFAGNGPYLIVNDTLFINHWAKAWMMMVNKLQKSNPDAPMIIGDLRNEKESFPEKGKRFLASWFFYMSNASALKQFDDSLKVAMNKPMNALSPAYEQYVNHWLRSKSLLTGWHGKSNAENINRKKQVIFLEHTLSLEIEKRLQLSSIGSYYAPYRFVRIIERLKTRFHAVKRNA